MRNLAIILARGGSKRLPKKNIASVAGKPLIAWTIMEAMKSDNVHRLVVSTDDPEIASIATHYGAEVPFIRPNSLADDNASSIEAVIHAIHWLGHNEEYHPDRILLLQPTSPLRASSDIDAAIQMATDRNADSVVSVCVAEPDPLWLRTLDHDKRILGHPWLSADQLQDYNHSPIYFLNGAIYLIDRSVLLRERTFYTERILAYVMPRERSLDIDSVWDLQLADMILRNRNKNEFD